MEATDILMEEHTIIKRVLTALETAAQRLEQGQNIRTGFFIDAADFIKGFADGCHHMKEEGVLFKAMIASGMPAQGGPINMMLAEHEQGRIYTRAMREAAQKLQAGDESGRDQVIRSARGYIALLRQHIHKEDNILFPMANRVIPKAEQGKVADDFEREERRGSGEGVHEKYLLLAEALEKESSS